MSELVGELEGLEDKNVAGRRFLSRPPAGALSGGSLIGVNAEISGRKIVKDFLLRLSDIVPNVYSVQSRSLSAEYTNNDLQGRSEDLEQWKVDTSVHAESKYGLVLDGII